jgi:hypothetical protein
MGELASLGGGKDAEEASHGGADHWAEVVPDLGQVVKLGLPVRRTDPDDGQADAVLGKVQGEGGAGGVAGELTTSQLATKHGI